MGTDRTIKRVLACGYYGFGNTGDEAILMVLVDDLRASFPGCEITVVSGDPEATEGLYGVDAIPWQSPRALIAAARETDLMVLGGGGLVQDYNGFDPSAMLTSSHGDVIWAEFAVAARLWSKPLVVYALGVGPLHTEEGKRAAGLVFDTAVAGTVRDQGSLDLVRQLVGASTRIELGADPVLALSPSAGAEQILEAEGIPAQEFTVGVCLRPWRTGLPVKEFAHAFDRLINEQSARVVFIPFQTAPTKNENDAYAAHQVMLAMERGDRASILRGAYGPKEKLALFGQLDAVIAMRLHAAMFGLMVAKPTVAIAYDPKVAQLMANAGQPVLELPGLEAGRLINALDRAVEQPGDLSELKARTKFNRDALARGAMSTSAEPDQAYEYLAEAALVRAEEAEEMRQLRYDLALANTINDHLRAELAEVWGSRAQELAKRYWKLKQTARQTRDSLRRAVTTRSIPTTTPGPERFNDPPDYGGAFELRTHYTRQLEQILEDHPQAVGYVVLPHSIGWQASLFQRPQQMALALARQGYLVFYGLDHYTREETDGFRWVAPNVHLFSMDPPFLDILKGVPRPLAITYVYNFRFVRHLHEPITVFEHIDELEVFTATHPMEHLHQWYEDAITEADLVSASAHDLLATVRKRRPDAILCQNGVDFDHFGAIRPGPAPPDFPQRDRPIIGYYGAMAEWLDYPLLDHAAAKLPEFDFVFIGPNYDKSMDDQPVFGRENVHWLGPKTYADLPDYLAHFTVATIPFVLNEVTHAVSPVKLHEYLAGGKPVVTTAMREASTYDILRIAANPDEWVEHLVAAALESDDPQQRQRRQMTARANTWDQRVGTLIDAAARLHLG